MKRSMFAAAMAAALAAGSAAAQSIRTPDLYDTRGLSVGLHLNGGAIASDRNDAAGAGGGLTLGYGVNDRLTLFLRGDVGYEMSQVDLGTRYRLGTPGSALRPYAEVAVSRVGTGMVRSDVGGEPFGDRLRVGGPALSAGAGVEYFFSRKLAVDVGLSHTRGRFTQGTLRDDEIQSGRPGFSTTRLNVGFTWRP